MTERYGEIMPGMYEKKVPVEGASANIKDEIIKIMEIQFETLNILNGLAFSVTGIDEQKKEPPEAKCMVQDVLTVRELALEISEKIRALRAVMGC